jgi:diguanylate cyclase (GGDEF)-like protein
MGRPAAASLTRRNYPDRMAGGLDAGYSAAVRELWDEARPAALQRVDAIENALSALMAGGLGDDERDNARREAHRLAGSLGTFGLRDATAHAAALEAAFEAEPAVDRVPELAQHAIELRQLIEAGEGGGAPPSIGRTPDVVAVGLAPAQAAALVAAGEERGLAVAAVGDLPEEWPPIALLDGSLPGPADDSLQGRADGVDALAGHGATVAVLLERVDALAGHGTTVAVLLERGSEHDRVELVRRGAQRLLPADASPDALIDALTALTESRRPPAGRILAIDDDPSILLVLEAILGGAGLEVAVLEDPLAVWAALERTRPDLVVCDVDMPGLDGIDLCRTLRADARWQRLPLLFLTGHGDAETLSRLFAAGADDYVSKPVLGPELLARVRNRLERVALQRELDDVDRLTGLLRRDAARAELDALLKLGRRLGQTVSIVALKVDGLEDVNREAGHVAGDDALAAAGRALRAAFAADGVASRWGGGELVVGMVGLGSHDVRDRVGAVLEEVRNTPVAGRRITLSAGLAEFPLDGEELDGLVGAAVAASREAHAAGGDRLETVAPEAAADQVDVALVEDDEVLAPLLVHALQTRGYRTRWIGDGDEAARLLGGPRPALRADLVLLDWDLPGRDGLTILRGLADDGGLIGTKVVMLTFRASEREILSTLEIGAVDHVAKPFSVPVLMQRIRRLLGQ